MLHYDVQVWVGTCEYKYVFSTGQGQIDLHYNVLVEDSIRGFFILSLWIGLDLRKGWSMIIDPAKLLYFTHCCLSGSCISGVCNVIRVCNPGPKWQSRKSGIFFKISRDPGNSRDLLKINFINHLDRDTRGPNPYTCKIPDSQQI